MIEAELKARVHDPAALGDRLRRLASEEISLYRDTYYDRPGRDLTTLGRQLRVRIMETSGVRRAVLTYKEPAADAGSGSKPEHETKVADAAVIDEIVRALGLQHLVAFEKHCVNYGDPVAEYWALLEGVTLWDVGVERQIEISGPGAFAFANMMTPRDLNKCAVRQAKYAFITLPGGGIANDPVLMRLEENRFWLSLADSDIGLWALGLAYHSGLDVTIGEVDVAPVQLQGPKSGAVMAGLFGEKIPELPYYRMSGDLELEGMRVCVSRTGYTSELGYEIYLHDATANGTKLWNTVLEAGRPHGLQVTGPCHIRRIEGGILAFGCDIWSDTNPFEVDMGYPWMVDLGQEADFVGKQALQRIKAEGPRRKLVGIEIEGPPAGSYIDNEMIEMYQVLRRGHPVGKVTSACYSPRLGKNIGYAMLPIERAEPLGQEFDIETPAGRHRGVTVPKPFIDPGKQIPKQ